MIAKCPHCGLPMLVGQPTLRRGMSSASGSSGEWMIFDAQRLAHRCPIDAPIPADGTSMPPQPFNTVLDSLLADLEAAEATDRLAQLIAQRVAPLLKATYSNLAIVEGTNLRIAHHDSLDREIAGRYLTVPLDDTTPLGTAILSGKPVLLSSLRSYESQYSHMIEDTRNAGISATISFPILNPIPMAAVGVAWSEHGCQSIPDGATAALANIAYSCAYALSSQRSAAF